MEYKKLFILPNITATCNILNHTLNYSISHHTSIVVFHHHDSQNMSMNGTPPKTTNVAPAGSLNGTQQWCQHNSEPSENCSHTATCKDGRFGKQSNQYYLPSRYGYRPSKMSYSGAGLIYHHSTFNTILSSQPTNSTRLGFPSHVLQRQGYDHNQGRYVGSQMFSAPQIPEEELSSPGVSQVPPELLETHPVDLPTSSSPNPSPEPPSGVPGWHPIGLRIQNFQPPADPRKSDIQGLRTCPHCKRLPTSSMMPIVRETICGTQVVQRANPHSAWSKPNSLWSNLPK